MYMNMQGVDEKCSSVLFSPKASQQSLHANNDLHPADRKTPCILRGQSRHTASHRTNASRIQAYASPSRSAEQARTLLRQWRCWQQHSRQQLHGKEKIWKLSKFSALVAQHISNNLLNWFWSVLFKMKKNKNKFDRASTLELTRQVVGSLPACRNNILRSVLPGMFLRRKLGNRVPEAISHMWEPSARTSREEVQQRAAHAALTPPGLQWEAAAPTSPRSRVLVVWAADLIPAVMYMFAFLKLLLLDKSWQFCSAVKL